MRRSILRVVFVALLISLTSIVPVIAQISTSEQRGPELPWSWSLQTYKKIEPIAVGGETLTVEIADTGDLQTRGLSYRNGLEPGTGMLFVYSDSENHTFWMKGMRFCLDIVWINDGHITGAAENVCPEPGVGDAELARYPSTGPAQFVLEVPAGWLKSNDFGVGTDVDLSQVKMPPGLAGG